jgi:hypothetical protein
LKKKKINEKNELPMKKDCRDDIQHDRTGLSINEPSTNDPFFYSIQKKVFNTGVVLNNIQNQDILLNLILCKKAKKAAFQNLPQNQYLKKKRLKRSKRLTSLLTNQFIDSNKTIKNLRIKNSPFNLFTPLKKKHSFKESLKTFNKPFPIIINQLNQKIRKLLKKKIRIKTNLVLLLTQLKISYREVSSKAPLRSQLYILNGGIIKNGYIKDNSPKLEEKKPLIDERSWQDLMFQTWNIDLAQRKNVLTVVFGKETKIKSLLKLTLKKSNHVFKNDSYQQVHFQNFIASPQKYSFLLKLGLLMNLYNLGGKNWSPYLKVNHRFLKNQRLSSTIELLQVINSRGHSYGKLNPLGFRPCQLSFLGASLKPSRKLSYTKNKKPFSLGYASMISSSRAYYSRGTFQFHQEKKKLDRRIWSWLIKSFSKFSMVSIATRYWLFFSTNLLVKPPLSFFFDKNSSNHEVNLAHGTTFQFLEGRTRSLRNQSRKELNLNGLNLVQHIFESNLDKFNSAWDSKNHLNWPFEHLILNHNFRILELRFKKRSIVHRSKLKKQACRVNNNWQDQISYADINLEENNQKALFLLMNLKESFFYFTNYKPFSNILLKHQEIGLAITRKTNLAQDQCSKSGTLDLASFAQILTYFKKNNKKLNRKTASKIVSSLMQSQICYIEKNLGRLTTSLTNRCLTKEERRYVEGLNNNTNPLLKISAFLRSAPYIKQTLVEKEHQNLEKSLKNFNFLNCKNQMNQMHCFDIPLTVQYQSNSNSDLVLIPQKLPLDLKQGEHKTKLLWGLTNYLLTFKRTKSFLKFSILGIKLFRVFKAKGSNNSSENDWPKDKALPLRGPLFKTKVIYSMELINQTRKRNRNNLNCARLNLLKFETSRFPFLTQKFCQLGYSLLVLNHQNSYLEHYLIKVKEQKKRECAFDSFSVIENQAQSQIELTSFYALKRIKEEGSKFCFANLKLKSFDLNLKRRILSSSCCMKFQFLEGPLSLTIQCNRQLFINSLKFKTIPFGYLNNQDQQQLVKTPCLNLDVSQKNCNIKKRKAKSKICFFYQVLNLAKKTNLYQILNNQDEYHSFLDFYEVER